MDYNKKYLKYKKKYLEPKYNAEGGMIKNLNPFTYLDRLKDTLDGKKPKPPKKPVVNQQENKLQLKDWDLLTDSEKSQLLSYFIKSFDPIAIPDKAVQPKDSQEIINNYYITHIGNDNNCKREQLWIKRGSVLDNIVDKIIKARQGAMNDNNNSAILVIEKNKKCDSW